MTKLQYLQIKVFSLLPENVKFNYTTYKFYKIFGINDPRLTFSTYKYLAWKPLYHISGRKDSRYCCYIERIPGIKYFLDLLELQNEEFTNRVEKEGALFSPLYTIGHLARLQELKSAKIFLHSYLHDGSNVIFNHVSMYLNEHDKLVINETKDVIKEDEFDPTVIAPKKHWKPGYHFLLDENGNKISEHPLYA